MRSTTRRSRMATRVCGAVAAAAALAACNAPSSAAGGDGAVTVGLLANLTGNNAASFGVPFQRGFDIALAEAAPVLQAGGASLQVAAEDTRSDVAAAVTGFNRLAQQNVPVVVHDSQSPQGQAIAPLINDRKIAFLTGAGSALQNDARYAFRFTDLRTPTVAMGKYLIAHGATRVGVVIAHDNPSFTTLADVTATGLPNGYASRQEVGSSDTDFSAVLANLRKDGVDAVVLSVLPAQAGNLLLQMKRSGGFESVLKAGTLALSAETYTVAQDAARELVFPQVWAPGQQGGSGFEAAYQQKYGQGPTAYGALGYQVGWTVVAAVLAAHAKGAVNGTAVRDALPAASTGDIVRTHGILDLGLTPDGSAASAGTIATFGAGGRIVAVPAKG